MVASTLMTQSIRSGQLTAGYMKLYLEKKSRKGESGIGNFSKKL